MGGQDMNIVRKLYVSDLASKKDAFLCYSLSREEGQGGRLGGGVSPRIFPVCLCLGECIICGVMPDVQLSHGSQVEVTKQNYRH